MTRRVAGAPKRDSRFEEAPVGLLSVTDQGIVLTANGMLAGMVQLGTADIVGAHIERILTLPSRIYYHTHFFPLLTLHGYADEVYLTLRSADGAALPALVNAVRRQRDGEWVSDVALMPMRIRRQFEDELLAAKRAAEGANQAKSLFLSMMSHELRTPLNSIIGFARLVRRRLGNSIPAQETNFLERVESSGVHLLSVINDVLDLARIESGRVETIVAPLPLGPLVQDVVASLEGQPRSPDVALEVELPPGELVAAVDAGKLRQVLINLIGNALKFTAEGSVRVRVETGADGYPFAISVTDSGIGIPADRLGAIFLPFEQAESTTNRRFGGSGLGLSISRSLCHLFGAELTVTSLVGVGSTFTVTLGSAEEVATLAGESAVHTPPLAPPLPASQALIPR